METTWLRHPATWLTIAAAAVMGSIMTFSYIGGFLDPLGHLHDAPLAIVNQDAGADVAGIRLEAGQQVEDELVAGAGDRVGWQRLGSEAEARRKLRDNELWGAIVIPEDFSSSIAEIGTSQGTAPAAQLGILTNEGSGFFQSTFVETLSDTAVDKTAEQTSQQLVERLDQAHVTITAAGAATLGRPVVDDTEAVVKLPEKSGRSLAPFYLAVML
ncbi:MAG TPA: DUF3533 domain-containing protein, partial [Acidimicrobiales bacterium]|nr:DUF3533 domain-containing protein [Acidimicrobiales bacterium]